jgi:hypothetical protein
LKDEADLATALLDPETDAQWWLEVTREFGEMRPKDRPSYAEVLEEAPARMHIRSALGLGIEPPVLLEPRRQRLVVAQEVARFRKRGSFSCHCEGAEKLSDEELLVEEAA